jgi:hypothetical protein
VRPCRPITPAAPNGPLGGANLGGVTPYSVNTTSQFRSPPPPAFGSPAFEADLEVLTISQNTSLVTEAGLWRIYAGIHYRFDITAARALRTAAVAEWAISHEERLQ